MSEAEARRRHRQLTGIRLIGVATVLAGMAILSGRWLDAPLVGYAVVVLGGLEFFVLPRFLLKQWKALDE